jgi:protocatechuate 3,4-dioxygenase beta subunit
MDNDDRTIGKILTRREMLALLGAGGAAVLAACAPGASSAAQPTSAAPATTTPGAEAQAAATLASDATAVAAAEAANAAAMPACIVRPEMTEGPYFVDEQLERSDIRVEPSTGEVKEGLPLGLTFNVSDVTQGACAPLAGAMVDVWHCDAEGVYSGVTDNTVGFNTTGAKFLRGYQVTNANGVAAFSTIYPGWYTGRTVHIHFKIRTTGANSEAYEFTSQLYFDDAVSDQVFSQAPYRAKGQRDQLNATDRASACSPVAF